MFLPLPQAKAIRIAVGFTAVTAVILLCVVVFCPKPSLHADTSYSTVVTAQNGSTLRLSLATDDRYRVPLKSDEIHAFMIDATLLYEDRYYYSHPGVNPAALVRAAWNSYVRKTRPMGASTITMQLARIRFDLNTRSIGGKLIQIARAVQLERHYSKQQILTAYLNAAPYGGNIEGVGAAALIYFDKSAADLTLGEAAALAVIPQNPVGRNPASGTGYARMEQARRRLISQLKVLTARDAEQAEMLDLPLQVRSPANLPFKAPHFVDAVLATNTNASGMFETSLHLDKQEQIEAVLKRYVQRRHGQGINNASALLLDHVTMQVVASVGSASFFDTSIHGQVNGNRSPRSPGSTLKPFVYALALDQGLIHPMSLMKDAPRRFGAYTPENFDRGFMGPVTARDALIYSRNVPAIELLWAVGLNKFHRFLQQAGVQNLKPPEHYGLAMVLGGNEVTMEELVQLYAALANGGTYRGIRYDNQPNDETGTSLLSKEASYLVLDMLSQTPRPDLLSLTGHSAKAPIAWKTGTSYAFRDAWTVGVFDRYVLAVWVGNFDGSANPALVGRQAAAPLFFEIADIFNPGANEIPLFAQLTEQHNLKRVDVCIGTGDLAGRYCPASEKSWFIPGKSPIRVSNVHRSVRINRRTGLRACTYDAIDTFEQVYEFWPSDLGRLLRQAGTAVRTPPGFDKDCELNVSANSGAPPKITSPAPALTYLSRTLQEESDVLPLIATTDADVSSLHWFADDQYLGKVAGDQPLYWQPQPGTYQLLVVDDLGRSHSNQLTVLASQ